MQFIAVIIAGIIIFTLPPHLYLYKRYHYICPKNHKIFKPSFMQLYFSIIRFQQILLKCPYCSKREWVTTRKNEKQK